jgi:hypothetical protein
MYESPILITKAIDQITRQINEAAENQIFEAVLKGGVEVNREELIKALQYDRDQYDKGYEDGFRDGKNEVVQSEGEWKEVYRNNMTIVYECSNCHHLTFGTLDYCICGARMKGGTE